MIKKGKKCKQIGCVIFVMLRNKNRKLSEESGAEQFK